MADIWLRLFWGQGKHTWVCHFLSVTLNGWFCLSWVCFPQWHLFLTSHRKSTQEVFLSLSCSVSHNKFLIKWNNAPVMHLTTRPPTFLCCLFFPSLSLSLAHLVKHNLHRKPLKSNCYTVVNLMAPILCSCELVGFIFGIIQEEKD